VLFRSALVFFYIIACVTDQLVTVFEQSKTVCFSDRMMRLTGGRIHKPKQTLLKMRILFPILSL